MTGSSPLGVDSSEVVVVGAGAMGMLFSGLLTRAGRKVIVTDKLDAKTTPISRDGIRFSGVDGEFVVPVRAVTDPSGLSPAEWVLFCVKAYDTREAASRHAHLIGPDTVVVTLQNGLGNIESLSKTLPAGSVLAGTTSLGANVKEPGHVHFAGRGTIHLGELDGSRTQRLDRTAELFRGAGIETHTSDDVQTLLWSKLVVNVGINALTALLDVRNGALLELEIARGLMEEAVRESVTVASACGVTMDLDEALEQVKTVARATAENRSSMLADVTERRPTEVRQINGAVADLAVKHGLTATVNALLTRLVEAKSSARIRDFAV